ncbi:MAG: NRDE family protein [Pseudomarimonas sp.]
MCLIALAWNAHPHYALVLIGNRDEFHARRASPATWQCDDPNVIGGVDLQAGGSWLQLSRRGRLAAVTNFRQGLNPPPVARSRGALVVDFVRAESSAAEFALGVASIAETVGRHTLLLWDGSELWQSGNYPAAHAAPIAPGLHVLSNAELDAPWPKSLRVQRALADWLQTDAEASASTRLEPLFTTLADGTQAEHAELPATGIPIEWEQRLSSAFIRGTDYGTRCSTIVLIGHDGAMQFEERRFGAQGESTGVTRWQGLCERA